MSAPIQKSAAKIKAAAQVVTANRLADGIAVYLDPTEGWSERLGEAAILVGPEALAAAVAAGKAAEARHLVVDSYPIDVAVEATGVRPLRLREEIRAFGPTVRPDLSRPLSA
jgi:hypothetical protein